MLRLLRSLSGLVEDFSRRLGGARIGFSVRIPVGKVGNAIGRMVTAIKRWD